ncbi:MAG: UDP-4-amino-4,6-dideoxy-N-acetyl-beta-L-altrosamine transaminase [Deltaproteobacteria bacterium]|nr:UDP-4-amino-4,6-dideoxy-N-acetyl-beta-L-altrosamine transaminase [Deltaproteobacteria bacterium]
MEGDAFIPYGRQQIDDDDIDAVVEVLRSDWLTTGPKVAEFEEAVSDFAGARHGVAVSSGTAGLHAAMAALDLEPGDEVIVPTMTFAATANAVVFQGATPVFADVDSGALLVDPNGIASLITDRTRAVIAVDYAGQPADYTELRAITAEHGLALVSDACHSIGATLAGRSVGSLADLTVFSFHPVKHITTGEGGMVMTDDRALADRMRRFRNHGISTDHHQRAEVGTWFYEMVELGYNYRLTDIQSALGLSQLQKLPRWLDRRNQIAGMYRERLADIRGIAPLEMRPDRSHAYHLYVVRVAAKAGKTRDTVFAALRSAGVGANVHYIPVHIHPYYEREFSTAKGSIPVAEQAYEEILSLPMHHGLEDSDVDRVVHELVRALGS